MKTIRKFEVKARRIRVAEYEPHYEAKFSGPDCVTRLAREILKGETQEVFICFLLTVRNKLIGYEEIARGSLTACPVDPRVVFRTAILKGAAAPEASLDHSTQTGRKANAQPQ